MPPTRPLQAARHLTSLARNYPTMDISSGNVSFGRTCPGPLMQELLRDNPDQVRKITKFQTSLSTREMTYQCALPCEDLATVHKFITSINSLEEISVLNLEPDASALWPAIFHHGKSLHSLAIHTPPQTYANARTWTPTTVEALAAGVPNLRHLEMDISAEDAESLLTSMSSAQPSTNTDPANGAASGSPMATLTAQLRRMPQLNSVLINIVLTDAASALCGEHTWNVMGCIAFPEPNIQACERLAQVLVNRLSAGGNGGDAAEGTRDIKLQIRLTRRCWDDRCQFYTLGYSIPVTQNTHSGHGVDNGRDVKETVKDGEANEKAPSASWANYLPPWPQYEGPLWRLVEDYRKKSPWY